MAEGERVRADDIVPRRIRWFVRVFLAAFLVCGLAGIEAWPLSGFRLFSHLRHQQAVSWERTAVDADGQERAVNFAGLPDGYRSFVLVMTSFASRPRGEQDAMCRAWVRGLQARDGSVDLMRVYQLDQSLVPRAGGRPAAKPVRTLLFSCSGSGVSIADGA